MESGDYRPTEQSYAVFKELSAKLDKELKRLEQALAVDVVAFNKQLAAARLEPIK